MFEVIIHEVGNFGWYCTNNNAQQKKKPQELSAGNNKEQ